MRTPFCLLLMLFCAPMPVAAAQPPASDDDLAPDSPRAAFERYLELSRRGDYLEAARYLDLPESRLAEGPLLARRLSEVLNRNLSLDPEKISAKPEGDLADGLAPSAEQLGKIAGDKHGSDSVRLSRRDGPAGLHWIFSRATVQHIDGWYERLEDRWVLEHLPEALLSMGPRGLQWWQWLALPMLLGLASAFGVALSRLGRALLKRLTRRTPLGWKEPLLQRVAGPMTFLMTLLAVRALLPFLSLYGAAEATFDRILAVAFVVTFFWFLSRGVDVARQAVVLSGWSGDHPTSRTLIPLGSRIGKFAIVSLAVIAVLSQLGYPVGSLIAGLGIGGLAVALAAQKTMENLFGTFAIGIDQPLRQGDLVKIDDLSGTVESIGLRSTRIRTADRTLITLPNGRLADSRIESYAHRDRIRFFTVIRLAHPTPPAQVRQVLTGFEAALRKQPKLWTDSLVVRLIELTDASVNVEVTAWFTTTDFAEFATIRQEVLLSFIETTESAGATLADSRRLLTPKS